MKNFEQKLDEVIITKTLLIWIVITVLYLASIYIFYGGTLDYTIYVILHFYMCFVIAPTKNRNRYVWGILALIIGPLALLALKVMKPSKDGVW